MGLAHKNPYKKLSEECLNTASKDPSMAQQLLKLQLELEIMEYKMKQMEILTRTQSKLTCQPCQHARDAKDRDKDVLEEAVIALTKCDYYHGQMSWQESWRLLNNQDQGTFLVRKSQSQDAKYPFAISFQRTQAEGGPTSIRILLKDSKWSLDCEDNLTNRMPSFSTISSLIQYYQGLKKPNCLVALSKGLKVEQK